MLYKVFMSAGLIRHGGLTALGARRSDAKKSGRQEAAMFNFHRRAQLAGQSTPMDADYPPLAHLHAVEFALVLVSLLSIGWLVADASQSPEAFGVSAEWNCLGFGRAGGHCVKSSPATHASDNHCLMGRGGEICPLISSPAKTSR
jgi:hypothetical protein